MPTTYLVERALSYFFADGGSELTSEHVKLLLQARGTPRENIRMTTRDTPELNGLAERANRTTKEMALAMLSNSVAKLSHGHVPQENYSHRHRL